MSFVNNIENFIFIHPQKCAGGSVSRLLRDHFDTNLNSIFLDCGIRHAHPDFSEILYLTNKSLDCYFKFAVIRNTWDRVVSMYFHTKKHSDYNKSFEHFVFDNCMNNFSMQSKLTLDGKYIIDFTIRYEHLKEDVQRLMNHLNIKVYNLQCLTHNTNRNGAKYRDFYNQKTIDMVYNSFQWEIDKFNYKF